MGFRSYLPYYGDTTVRRKVDELFSREMLGAVLVGKFTGDYAAIWSTRIFGTDLGYILGIVVTITFFIYWQHIEEMRQKAQKKAEEATEDAKEKVTKKDKNETKNFI